MGGGEGAAICRYIPSTNCYFPYTKKNPTETSVKLSPVVPAQGKSAILSTQYSIYTYASICMYVWKQLSILKRQCHE